MNHTVEHPSSPPSGECGQSMMERLARSLEPIVFSGNVRSDGFVDLNEAGAYACVRAILTELREPSEEVLAVGEAATFEWMAEPRDYTTQSTKDGWQAMIDAILGRRA